MDSYQPIYDAVCSRIGHPDIAGTVERVFLRTADFSGVVVRTQEALNEVRNEWTRPSVVYRPQLGLDGNMYCALYGSDLMNGVAGFGETAESAMRDFDKNWYRMKAPQPAAIEAAK